MESLTLRVPESPRVEKLGSSSAAINEIESGGTAAAIASSNSTIARSMSRYKGTRRNQRPYERSPPPKVPSRPLVGKSQDLPNPAQKEPLEIVGAPPHATQHSNHNQSAFAENFRSNNTMDEESRDELPHATAAAKSKARDVSRHKMHVIGKVESQMKSREAEVPLNVAGEPRNVDTGLAKETARHNTNSNDDREKARDVHRDKLSGKRSGKVASSTPRPGIEGDTRNDKLGFFSQRMAAQASRPQAFRQGSSREELKKMISAPISPEVQEAQSTACIPIPQNHNKDTRQEQAQELSLAPRFDAPISAVNAGQRIVRVKYEGSDLFLPVNPSTTPVDVIRAAGRQLCAPIDETSTVLLESFKQVGLERPLRKYEHIRDVLNSWDNDAQNILIITSSPSGGKDDDLDACNVSKDQPGETSVYMYYSQKPGSWDKRWVTLRSDGQVVVAKKNHSETNNICHLSDFDIYMPTPRYSSKKIKPPKKVCFAVKSQQKSSVFMTTENFVHFFCTSDRQLGTTWYKAVQEWRSWYLVNVMGEGHKSIDDKGTTRSARRNSVSGGQASRHLQQPSVDRNGRPHSGPSLTTTAIKQPTAEAAGPTYPTKHTKDPYTKAPTTSRDRPAVYQNPAAPAPAPAKEPFDPASLLGRTYQQRQQAQQQAQHSNIDPRPSLQVRSNRDQSPSTLGGANGLNRHSSTRQKPKPLVDLTPVYKEPPQHSKKGRGHIPSQIPAGGLVEVATSPENPLDIPSATTWRKPITQIPPLASPSADDVAFTGGLLGRSSTQRRPPQGYPIRTIDG